MHRPLRAPVGLTDDHLDGRGAAWRPRPCSGEGESRWALEAPGVLLLCSSKSKTRSESRSGSRTEVGVDGLLFRGWSPSRCWPALAPPLPPVAPTGLSPWWPPPPRAAARSQGAGLPRPPLPPNARPHPHAPLRPPRQPRALPEPPPLQLPQPPAVPLMPTRSRAPHALQQPSPPPSPQQLGDAHSRWSSHVRRPLHQNSSISSARCIFVG
jgi:hypothetical protein